MINESKYMLLIVKKDHRDRLIIGYTATYAISVYRH